MQFQSATQVDRSAPAYRLNFDVVTGEEPAQVHAELTNLGCIQLGVAWKEADLLQIPDHVQQMLERWVSAELRRLQDIRDGQFLTSVTDIQARYIRQEYSQPRRNLFDG